MPLETRYELKSQKAILIICHPKGAKLLATKSDHKRPQFLSTAKEMDFHTLTMMLVFDGFLDTTSWTPRILESKESNQSTLGNEPFFPPEAQ